METELFLISSLKIPSSLGHRDKGLYLEVSTRQSHGFYQGLRSRSLRFTEKEVGSA